MRASIVGIAFSAAPRDADYIPVGHRTLGAVTFVLTGAGRPYGEEQLAIARDVAGRAALAIDNARLFRDQRHIASAPGPIVLSSRPSGTSWIP